MLEVPEVSADIGHFSVEHKLDKQDHFTGEETQMDAFQSSELTGTGGVDSTESVAVLDEHSANVIFESQNWSKLPFQIVCLSTFISRYVSQPFCVLRGRWKIF
ncbi:hypothetical protein RF11_15669 [Thelohanellus kitauei]|uniref:Uncharacterized protein n=1 Tax=Thelohanellus kitauei TaxID=669202 RepID=A0A0C2MRN3_THEKT|nr:hypothetical protein RF11_15669 [Thelohanellus kitauei]